jgi:hypothetical protein
MWAFFPEVASLVALFAYPCGASSASRLVMAKAQKLALCIDILAESDSRSVVNIPERLGF